MKLKCELSYTDDGLLEVLYSPGYGAGWSSSWNSDYGMEIALDKRIIDFFKAHMNDKGGFDKKTSASVIDEFMKSIGYTGYIYYSGFYDCRIAHIKPGITFRIGEYDGSEYFDIFDENEWFTVEEKKGTNEH